MSKARKMITSRFKELMEYEKKILKINHDDLRDHDDISSHPETNEATLLRFIPNALLLAETSVAKKKMEPKIVEPEKTPDIWEILDQLKKEKDNSLKSVSDINEKVCKNCNGVGTYIEEIQTSNIICSKCGIVIEELLDQGPEWRQYNNDDNRNDSVNRCGCPTNFFFPKSSQGTIIVGLGNNSLKRKQEWGSIFYKEKSLNKVFNFIVNICASNGIPKIIIDDAKSLYKRISDCKHKEGTNIGKQIIIRGVNRVSVIAACVFKACEINKNPRSTKEIAAYFKLNDKKVTRGNKQFEKIIENIEDTFMFDHLNPNTAEDYIRRHCQQLKIPKNYTDIAVKISNNCCKMKLASDHNPQSIAAGSILVMANYCDLGIDKKRISKLFGTSDVTIGKIYKKISPYVNALVDDSATDHLVKQFKING